MSAIGYNYGLSLLLSKYMISCEGPNLSVALSVKWGITITFFKEL